MFLKRLYVHNFRNIKEAHLEFAPHVNIIYGDNAQGKTSILEAVYIVMTGRSFRTAQLSDVIKRESTSCYIEAHFLKHNVEHKVKIALSLKERHAIYNSTKCSSLSDLIGGLQGVAMTPSDQELIKGPPQERRQYLDLQLAQSDPVYLHHLTRYHRAMRQRNYLLKAKIHASIESWEFEMAHAASYIITQRHQAVKDLNSYCQHLFQDLSGTLAEITIQYKTFEGDSLPPCLKSYYLDQYKKLRRREMDLGSTLIGPHKDDFEIKMQQQPARTFASEGQQRIFSTVLRLAEWQRLFNLTDQKPLFLADDIGTSLDDTRRSLLLHRLQSDIMGQVIATTTHATPAASQHSKSFPMADFIGFAS